MPSGITIGCGLGVVFQQPVRVSRQSGQSLARDPNTWTENEREKVRTYLDWLVQQIESKPQKTSPAEKVEATA